MTIAVDLRPLLSGKISGVEVYLQNMLRALFEAGPDHRFVLWTNAYAPADQSLIPQGYPNARFLQTRIPNKILNLSLSLLRWPAIDSLAGEPVDVLWVPDPRPAPVSKRCKKVVTFHDLSFEDFKYAFTFKTRLWHRVLRPRKEAEEADRIVAVSDFTAGQLQSEYGIAPEKITVIHESGDHVRPLPLPKSLEMIQRKYGVPGLYFLCLSTLEPRKNIHGIIEAYTAWQSEVQAPVSLVIAGQKHPSIFREVAMKHHPMIHFTGFVDEADKPFLYQHAMAFLYPSFYEGFGLPILEAMQCGAPVVTSDDTAMPEVAGGAALLVNPNQQEALKNALHQLYRDGALRENLRQKGLVRAAEFSWKKAGESLLRVFESLGPGQSSR